MEREFQRRCTSKEKSLLYSRVSCDVKRSYNTREFRSIKKAFRDTQWYRERLNGSDIVELKHEIC